MVAKYSSEPSSKSPASPDKPVLLSRDAQRWSGSVATVIPQTCCAGAGYRIRPVPVHYDLPVGKQVVWQQQTIPCSICCRKDFALWRAAQQFPTKGAGGRNGG